MDCNAKIYMDGNQGVNMLVLDYREIDATISMLVSNLLEVIPNVAGSDKKQVVWVFAYTNCYDSLLSQKEFLSLNYPSDIYAVTTLIPSRSLTPWVSANVQEFLVGDQVMEVDSVQLFNNFHWKISENFSVEYGIMIFAFFLKKKYLTPYMQKIYDADKKVIYKKNGDLSLLKINNAIVHPLEISETGMEENCQYGGVTDENLQFIKLSLTERVMPYTENGFKDWYVGANPRLDISEIPFVDEDVVFLGPLSHHFGHFIIECLSRLWFYLDPPKGNFKAVYISNKGVDRFNEFFNFFGLKKDQIIKIEKATQFRSVIIPQQSVRLHDYYHGMYKSIIDHISKSIVPKNFKKVYFSKRLKKNNRAIGEIAIENIFQTNGYHVFYPEELTLYDTLAILKGADFFVASSATNAHNAIFLRDGTTTVILNRSNHLHYFQTMIDEIRCTNSYYVDANVSILPSNFCVGPFLFGPTKNLLMFLDDCNYSYNKEQFFKTFVNSFAMYVKLWSATYENKKTRCYLIDESDMVFNFDTITYLLNEAFSHVDLEES